MTGLKVPRGCMRHATKFPDRRLHAKVRRCLGSPAMIARLGFVLLFLTGLALAFA